MKTTIEMEAEAAKLENGASVNDAYAQAMEKCGGADRSPCAYSAHVQAAASKRARAATLRGILEKCKMHGEFNAIGCAVILGQLPAEDF